MLIKRHMNLLKTIKKDDDQRVVITGMGVITPLGFSLSAFYSALMSGISAVKNWQHEMHSKLRIKGDLTHFDVKGFLNANSYFSEEHVKRSIKLLRSTPVAGRMACMASLDAYYCSGLSSNNGSHRMGCILGGHHFNLDYGYKNAIIHQSHNEGSIDPLFGLVMLDNDLLASVTELLHIKGPGLTIGNGYTSGHQAVLAGKHLINCGRADVVLVASASQMIDPLLIDSLIAQEIICATPYDGKPEKASRPFEVRRSGFVPSQGAGAVVLERLDCAKQRNAPIYAELFGGASEMELTRSFYPSIHHAKNVMRKALQDAKIRLDQVDYINAHADSTPIGDAIELRAIQELLGRRAYVIPINALKSMMGHTLTSAGLIECIATVLQIQHNTVHPTINLDEISPEFKDYFIPKEGIDYVINRALSNAYSFYGFASSILLGRFYD